MAKPKQKVAKAPKKHSPKYSKIATTCSKELATKKKALASAEKALAKAQKAHSELLSEVARLDMLDRSLKALINGTEPPQNIRYVYTYPQWVWYPYNGWYGNNPYTYTVTLGATGGTQFQNFQGGQFTNANSGSLTTTNAINTVSYPATSGNITLSNASIPSGGLTLSNAGSFTFDSNSSGLSNSVLTSTSAAPQWQTVTTTTNAPGVGPDLTVDLSTGAADPEATIQLNDGSEVPDGSYPDEQRYPLSDKKAEVGHGG